MIKYILFSLFPILLLNGLSYGQDTIQSKKYAYSVGGYISRGFIVMHDKEMGHLAQSHTEGISIFFKKHTYGNRNWEKIFRYPDIGVSMHYLDFNNPILGKAYSALGFMDYYIIRKNNNFFTFRFGFGIGYSTNPYDAETNNKNIAMGSAFTYSALAKLTYTRHIASGLNLEAGFKLSHFSNGAFKMPNKGINIPTADIGLSYALSNTSLPYPKNITQPEIDTRIHYNLSLASGLKEIDPVGSKKFSFVTLSMYASKQTSLSNGFTLGLDAFYSYATKEEIKTDRDLNGAQPDFKRVGLAGGHELFLGKLSLQMQLGVYLYRPYKSDKPVYQRYGFKYHFRDQFFGGFYLKTHYGKADAVEYMVGFKL